MTLTVSNTFEDADRFRERYDRRVTLLFLDNTLPYRQHVAFLFETKGSITA